MRFRWPVKVGVTYPPEITGTYPSVIPPVAIDGSTFVDDPELVPVLSGIHLLTLEGWKTGLVLQPKDIERSVGVTSTENRTWVTRMVAQWFTDYAAAVFKIGGLKKFLNIHRKTPVLVFLFNKFVGNAYLHYKWPSWQGKKQFSTTLP